MSDPELLERKRTTEQATSRVELLDYNRPFLPLSLNSLPYLETELNGENVLAGRNPSYSEIGA
jgi:hypothetical protein